MKELNQRQVSNTHLRESFLTHIARVFGFVDENPCEAECIWGITPIFWERPKSCKFLSQANNLKFFKRIWNNLYGLMARNIITYPRLKHRMLKFQFMTIRTNVTMDTTKVANMNKFRNISIPNNKSILRFWFLPQQRTIWSNMTNNTTNVTSRHKKKFIMLSNSRFRLRFRNISVYIKTFTFV